MPKRTIKKLVIPRAAERSIIEDIEEAVKDDAEIFITSLTWVARSKTHNICGQVFFIHDNEQKWRIHKQKSKS
jgi:hypothetical protein